MARGRRPRTVKEHGPHPVDVHVGRRLRQRRIMLGMSLMELGKALGITYQQVQKNEWGTNRMGSSRLYQLSQILDVPVSYFFDDMPPEVSGEPRRKGRPSKAKPTEADTTTKRESLELVRAYYRIQSAGTRAAVYELIKAAAD